MGDIIVGTYIKSSVAIRIEKVREFGVESGHNAFNSLITSFYHVYYFVLIHLCFISLLFCIVCLKQELVSILSVVMLCIMHSACWFSV